MEAPASAAEKPPAAARRTGFWGRVRHHSGELFLTGPSFLWMVLFFAVPTALVFLLTFRPTLPDGGIDTTGWTLATWAGVAMPNYPAIVLRTVWLSFAATALCILISLPCAFAMARARAKWRSIMVGLVIVTVSEIVTFVEGIGYIANIGTAIGGVMLLIVVFEAYVRKKIDAARVMLCYAFNCVVIPIAFFSCGGIDSGMPIYMIAGIFTIIPVLKGRRRLVCLLVSFVMDILCMGISYYLIYVDTGAEKRINLPVLTPKARFIDIVCSVILISLYIIITFALVMDAYQKERASREELVKKLDELSKRDELTGLYNRRELFSFLEGMTVLEGHYLCMMDIDHFKNVNDT